MANEKLLCEICIYNYHNKRLYETNMCPYCYRELKDNINTNKGEKHWDKSIDSYGLDGW